MKRITTVIIGAGQSGLAMSRQLSERSIDHIVIERGEVANSWRTERWDSLRLLTPNWQSRLPGYSYEGKDVDGYMSMPQVISFLDTYAQRIDAPIQDNTRVISVRQSDYGYIVETDRGTWHCRFLVIATGACNIASVPKIAEGVPAHINMLTSMQYRNPGQLEQGGVMVVGASATGAQLAREIQKAGHQVTMAAGEHVRVPRIYRGRDIKWWMVATGILDMRYDEVDDIRRARKVPSLQLAGSDDRANLDLNTLRAAGVQIAGRVADIRDHRVQFSGSLGNICALADLKMNRLLGSIDDWVREQSLEGEVDPAHRFEPIQVDKNPLLNLDLRSGDIKTIIWATGYRPDYSWLQVPVLDAKGRIRHDGGVVEAPGMYVMGLPFLRRRKSSLIDGAKDDACDLADHLTLTLNQEVAA